MKHEQLTTKVIRQLDRLRLDATKQNIAGTHALTLEQSHLESDFRDSLRYYWPQLKALALRALRESATVVVPREEAVERAKYLLQAGQSSDDVRLLCHEILRLAAAQGEGKIDGLREDAERWQYGVKNGFPERARANTTATVSETWYYQKTMFVSADAAIDAARRDMDKDDLVKRLRFHISCYTKCGDTEPNPTSPELELIRIAADALSRSRDEALEEAAKACEHEQYELCGYYARTIRALKIAAPQEVAGEKSHLTVARATPPPAESATALILRKARASEAYRAETVALETAAESATVVVPREPDSAMLQAGRDEYMEVREQEAPSVQTKCARIYRAMLAAAQVEGKP